MANLLTDISAMAFFCRFTIFLLPEHQNLGIR